MSTTTTATAYTLELRQRITPLQNRYDLTRIEPGGEATSLAYAEQKRFSLKERVTFWSGQDKQDVAFTIAARNVIELVGTYDVADPSGAVLATIRKDGRASLLRSTYRVELPGRGTVVGQERGTVRSVLRRVVGIASDFPWPLPIHFDFADDSGRVLLAIERQFKLRDVYRVNVAEADLDWRVAAAMAVAVDAFMNR